MDWVQQMGGRGPQLIIHDASVPVYLYYTGLHPERGRYARLQSAHLPTWDTDYGALLLSMPDSTAYVLFTGGGDAEREKHLNQIPPNIMRVDSFARSICWGYKIAKR